jgi:hypothetical protein
MSRPIHTRFTGTLLVLLLFLLVGLSVACGDGDDSSSQSGSAQQTTAVADPLGEWIAYTAPDGSFSVRLPEEPEVQEQTIETAEGDVTLAIYAVEGKDAAWLISANTMPPITAEVISSGDEDKINEILQGGRDGALANLGGTLDREETIDVDGNPGLEVRFTAPGDEEAGIDEIKGAARIIMVGPILYQVVVMTMPEGMDETVQPYLESFMISSD